MAQRRALQFASEQDVIADVERLRREGYEQAGEWSLPRCCWHLSRVIEMTLHPAPPGAAATPEQAARLQAFQARLASMPAGMPAPPAADPPPRTELSAIDEFIEKTRGLPDFPHPTIYVEALGPIPFAEVRRMHLAHAAHHLSFLIPNN